MSNVTPTGKHWQSRESAVNNRTDGIVKFQVQKL